MYKIIHLSVMIVKRYLSSANTNDDRFYPIQVLWHERFVQPNLRPSANPATNEALC